MTEATKIIEVPASVDDKIKTAQGISLKPELKASRDKAKQIQKAQIDDLKRRRENPKNVVFNPQSQCPITQFTDLYIGEGESGYTAPESAMASTIARGYEPVINPATGDQVRVGEDLGFKRPKVLTDAALEAVGDMSRARVSNLDQNLKSVTKGVGIIKEDETDISRK